MSENACAPMDISPRAFARFQALVGEVAGISLPEHKQALLVGRLSRRVRELGLSSFEDYLEAVAVSPSELVHMLDRISTNETHFFREPEHFRLLGEELVPKLMEQAARGEREKRVRVWSAACSTGQEPYSIAMVLLDKLGGDGAWTVEILASDLSTKVLEVARNAIWPIARSSEIPDDYLSRFMRKGTGSQEGKMRASPELRQVVRFERINLNEDLPPTGPPFDFIFCRNVLIYFDRPTRERVVARLLSRLSPGGTFFVGHAESLHRVAPGLTTIAPTTYVRTGAGEGARAP